MKILGYIIYHKWTYKSKRSDEIEYTDKKVDWEPHWKRHWYPNEDVALEAIHNMKQSGLYSTHEFITKPIYI